MTVCFRAAWRAAGLAAMLLAVAGGPAGAYEELPGRLLASRDCPATVSIRRDRTPGAQRLRPGETYAVHALNKPGGDYLHVTLPGAEPARRWVARDCGTLLAGPRPEDDRPLLPFFDAEDAPADPAPAPPALTPLDEAVLELCGDWGSRPEAAAFRRMLDGPAVAAEVAALRQALGSAVLGPVRDAAGFKDELTDAWFAAQGFAHIFCGEPGAAGLGGLHFAGRYLQMQQQGWGGRTDDCARSEIAPPVYTLGLRYRIPAGGMAPACPKGYALTLDAGGLFLAATRALRHLHAKAREACLYRVAEPGQGAFLAVAVARGPAIRTFYPDASPACDGGRPAETCLCDAP